MDFLQETSLYWELSGSNFQYNPFIYSINKMTTQLENIISYIGISLGVIGAIGALFWLIKTATSKKVKLFNLEIERNLVDEENYSEIIDSIKKEGSKNTKPGVEQLSKYYIQISEQTKISFWFGIIFASFGFSILLIIMFSNTYSTSKITILLISTVIIEGVSVLFFSRSNKARKEMGTFFSKLRKDRQQGISRKLVESIEDSILKDTLKIQLALYYSGIQNDTSSINEAIQSAIKKALENK